jgi:DnaJ homolog subfamily A member 5
MKGTFIPGLVVLIDLRQFEAHLKGKKHIKAAHALRKAMREENESLGFSEGISSHGTSTPVLNDPPKYPQPPITTPDAGFDNEDNLMETPSETAERDELQTSTPIPANVDTSDSTEQVKANDADNNVNPKAEENKDESEAEDSDIDLEREMDKLFLGTGRSKKERQQLSNDDGKPKIGAAKAKRLKKAEKQAALEAEGKAPSKPKKNRKPYDPSAAMQKARGEIMTTGRKAVKKK